MHDDAARDVLRGVLSSGSMLGARLRPLLIEAYRRATTRDVVPVLKSYGKFSAFLAANADLVDVRSDDKSGDIRVSLKTAETQHGPALRPSRHLSRELWQAFTNPDERRRRFYHRDTREIIHYLDDSYETLDKSLARRVSSDDKFVGIQFAHARDQNGWMREFLDSTNGLPDSTRRVAGHLVSVPYESSVNWAFVSALGAYGKLGVDSEPPKCPTRWNSGLKGTPSRYRPRFLLLTLELPSPRPTTPVFRVHRRLPQRICETVSNRRLC